MKNIEDLSLEELKKEHGSLKYIHSDKVDNITVYQILCSQFNSLYIEVGTNIPQGGDSGHGGVTIFKIKSKEGISNTNWKVLKYEDGVEIILKGDSEGETFIDALGVAYKLLMKSRMRLNGDEL